MPEIIRVKVTADPASLVRTVDHNEWPGLTPVKVFAANAKLCFGRGPSDSVDMMQRWGKHR
jgi:hypothetical protein